MPKKKVLFIVHQLNFGGVQKALLAALNAVDYEKYDVTLYIRKNRTELLDGVNGKVSRVIINDDETNYYRKPYAVLLFALIKLLGIFKADTAALDKKLRDHVIRRGMEYEKKRFFSDGVRYDTAVSYIQGYTALFTAEYVDADKKVMFYHGSVDESHEVHERAFPAFARLAAVNDGCREVLCGLYPEFADKFCSVENYVDEEAVREKSTADCAIEKRGVTVCTCGRLAPVKGFDMAVEAAKILKERGVDFIWYFVGGGPEKGKLEKLIEKYYLENNVIITGMLDNPYPYLAACDIYVQSSREEAHPLSIIEAQILCRPVVSTATVGGKCLVAEDVTGLLAGFSGASLADNVMRLNSSEELVSKIKKTLGAVDHTAKREEYRRRMNELID